MKENFLEDLKEKFKESLLELKEDTEEVVCVVKKEYLFEVAKRFKERGFDHFIFATAVDLKDKFLLVYRIYSMKDNKAAVIKTELPRRSPKASSLTSLWEGANWHEREVYDLFGIEFLNHPDLRRILLPDDWKGHPLRKDYKDKEVERRPELF